MKSLMKMDFWLMRWVLLFFVFFAPLSGIMNETGTSMNGMLIVFIMSLSLTQMDEKQNTRRFMLSLPLPLKAFFQARTIFVLLVSVLFLILESLVGFIGSSSFAMGDLVLHFLTQVAVMLILAPIAVSMFTLLHPAVIKYILTFVTYIAVVIIGSLFSFYITSLTSVLGASTYILAAGIIVVAGILCWLILMLTNKIRAGMDLV